MQLSIVHDDHNNMREKAFSYISTTEGTILEVGCGKGNFAKFMLNPSLKNRYIGIDIQFTKILKCKKLYPDLKFFCRDMTKSSRKEMKLLWRTTTFCSFQTLEHVGNKGGFQDVSLLDRIQPGTEIIISIPNYTAIDHKRWFDFYGWVERYKDVVNIEKATIFKSVGEKSVGNETYLFYGHRNSSFVSYPKKGIKK